MTLVFISGGYRWSKIIFLSYVLLFMLLQLSHFFPLFAHLYPAHPTPLTQAIPTPLSISMVHAYYVPWLLSALCCTLHPYDYSVTTNLYLVPSPFHPTLQQPSHLATVRHFLYLWFCFCFVCLFYLLDSIVDRCAIIAILLFIFLILFSLKKTL